MNCKICVTSVVDGETVSPPLTESKALPEEIPAFSLCIKDTGCKLKQTLQIHPYIYGCIFYTEKNAFFTFYHTIIETKK